MIETDFPIDRRVLERLFQGSPDIQQSILEEFSRSLVECQGELDEAYRERSAEKLCAFAHKTKSSSRTLGANRLADLCESLESAGRRAQWALIDTLVPQFVPEITAVRDFIAD